MACLGSCGGLSARASSFRTLRLTPTRRCNFRRQNSFYIACTVERREDKKKYGLQQTMLFLFSPTSRSPHRRSPSSSRGLPWLRLPRRPHRRPRRRRASALLAMPRASALLATRRRRRGPPALPSPAMASATARKLGHGLRQASAAALELGARELGHGLCRASAAAHELAARALAGSPPCR